MSTELQAWEVAENDATAARAREELADHLPQIRTALDDGEDRTYVIAVIAQTLIAAQDTMPRDRLASLLATAMVQIAEADR